VKRVREDGTRYDEQVPLTEWDVLHPQEDDFIVHNQFHNELCSYLKTVFLWALRGRENILVLHDHRVDWQTAGLIPHGPDVVVFLDTPPHDPYVGTYRVRDEGARPIFVVEVTSPSTRRKDLNEKVFHYCRAGIPLYVIVDDAEGENGATIDLLAYTPSPEGPVRVILPDANRIWLPEVNLWLAVQGEHVVCQEADGKAIGNYTEIAQAAEAETARAEAEKARAESEKNRADAAELKLKELEIQLRRLRGQ
jgi:Uma2 family endonuclease